MVYYSMTTTATTEKTIQADTASHLEVIKYAELIFCSIIYLWQHHNKLDNFTVTCCITLQRFLLHNNLMTVGSVQ